MNIYENSVDNKCDERQIWIWDKNTYHQFGILYDMTGKYIYEGYWKNGKRDGYGVSYAKNGSIIYQGYWYQNDYHGFGTLYDQNGSVILQGKWQHNRYIYDKKQHSYYDGFNFYPQYKKIEIKNF